MASSPSPLASPSASNAVVIGTRCSFETFDAFCTAEKELHTHQHNSSARDIRRRPTKFVAPPIPQGAVTPVFVTSVRSESKFSLKTSAARCNDHIRTPCKPPSDFQHRPDSPPTSWRVPGVDFTAKFRLPSNQDLRSSTALDQEGFFVDDAHCGAQSAGVEFIKTHEPGAGSARAKQALGSSATTSARQEFQTRVPHTARKSSNVALRLETILDQDGILPQLHEAREHRFRDEAQTPVPFRATFKSAPPLRPIGSSDEHKRT